MSCGPGRLRLDRLVFTEVSNLIQVVTRFHTVSRALRQRRVFAWSFDWFNELSVFFLTEPSDV